LGLSPALLVGQQVVQQAVQDVVDLLYITLYNESATSRSKWNLQLRVSQTCNRNETKWSKTTAEETVAVNSVYCLSHRTKLKRGASNLPVTCILLRAEFAYAAMQLFRRSFAVFVIFYSTHMCEPTQWLKYKFGGGGNCSFGLGPSWQFWAPCWRSWAPCWWTRAPCARYWYSASPI